jgi:hypothetical protein
MKKHLFLSFLSVMTCISGLMAQSNATRNCGTMEHFKNQQLLDPTLKSKMDLIEVQTANFVKNANLNKTTAAVVTIPVVFHVVYATSAENITDAKCIEQLNQLNFDFAKLNRDTNLIPAVFRNFAADTKIQFCLAQRDPNGAATTGIIHKATNVTTFNFDDKVKYTASGGDNAWPANSYLNIWTCNLGGGLLGYAQFPGGANATDGVVILYSAIGSNNSPGTATPYHLGRTATHEVGHWLNLRHIWGDANCGDDFVNDTPTQQTSNSGCPSFPHITCSNGTNGDMYMNYMDYTNDACMSMFTVGQTTRMNALFATGGIRSSLTTSLGCKPLTFNCGAVSGINTTATTANSTTINWTAVTGAMSYNIQYRLVGNPSWTSTTSTSNTKIISGLIASSNYELQIKSVCSLGASAFSPSVIFSTTSSACNIATGLFAASYSSTTVSLGWAALAGAVSYNIQYRKTGTASWAITSSTTNNIVLSGLLPSSIYEYQVQTVCALGLSSFTTSTNFATIASTVCTDVYEPNNTSGTSKTIPVNNSISGLINTASDADWYNFRTTAPNTNVKINLTNLAADYDVVLYDSLLNVIGRTSNASTTAEQIIANTTVARKYFVKVNGYNYVNLVTYSFSSGTASAITPTAKISISPITIGNNNGTTTLITNTSASSGYTGFSGTFNAGVSARVGALSTTTSGSAYFQFTITPNIGNAISVTGLNFGSRSTSTGPKAFAIRSSVDNYTTNIATGTLTNTSAWALKLNSVNISTAIGTAVTFRIYGYNGTGSNIANTANWRIDDISVLGSSNGFNATSCYNLNVSTGAANFKSTQSYGNSNISIYPNPAHQMLNVDFSSDHTSPFQIKVLDQLGRIIINKNTNVVQGKNTILINVSRLQKGIYYLKINGISNSSTHKFFVE